MKQKSIFLLAVFFALTFVFAAESNAQGLAIGAKIDSFSLPDTNGKTQSLNDLKGEKGTVVVFLSAQCPVVKIYNERLNQIAADYKAKGINFIGINSNATESLEWVKSHAEETYNFTVLTDKSKPDSKSEPVRVEGNFRIPVLIDKGNVLADLFGANVTPEVFYFNEKNVLLYHGAIDNDKSGSNITSNLLRDAFDLTLAGKPVVKTTYNAIGCSIKRAKKE